MKCRIRLDPATGKVRGATLYTSGVELMVVGEALRMYADNRDNDAGKIIAEHMVRDLINREIEDEPKTERSAT